MKKRVYLLLEIKRIFKAALKMFAGAIVLAVIVGAIAFCAQKLLYNDSLMDKIRVGIVLEDDGGGNGGILGSAMSFLESMDSVKATCEFIYMDQDAAKASLALGDLSAVMIVPPTLVEDIINGTNTPVRVMFGNEDTLTAAMLEALTKAGARTLGSAQAGIYTVYDVYASEDAHAYLQEAYDALNGAYLKLALARSRAFDYETVSVTGALSNKQYYAVMAVVFFILLTGMGLAGALRREKQAFLWRMESAGMSGWKCLLMRFCAVWLMYSVLTAVLSAVLLWLFGADTVVLSGPPGIVGGIVCTALIGGAFAAALFVLLYELAPTAGSGVLFVFIAACGSMLISGGIIPSGFLPAGVAAVGRWLPAGLLLRIFWGLMSGAVAWQELLLLLGYSVLLLILSMAVRVKNGRVRSERAPLVHSEMKKRKMTGAARSKGIFSAHYGTWLLLAFKRLFKRPSFILILLLFPLCCVLVERAGNKDEQPVNIAIYAQGAENDFNLSVVNKLLSDDGILNFYVCESAEQVRSDVAALRAECGYILPDELVQNLRLGKNKSLVRTIVSPATVSARLVDEVVFSYIFQEYSPEILLRFLNEETSVGDKFSGNETDTSMILSALNRHLEDGSTFHFEFDRDVSDSYVPVSFLFGYAKGLLAVFIFICGLLGSYDSIKDRRRGVYVRLGYPASVIAPLLPALTAALCAGAVSWLALGLMGVSWSAVGFFEILVYVLFTSGYCSVLTGIFKNEDAFCMAIPVLTLGSLLSAVVPVQMQSLFAGAGILAHLFPPAWFLGASGSGLWLMLGGGVLLWGMGHVTVQTGMRIYCAYRTKT